LPEEPESERRASEPELSQALQATVGRHATRSTVEVGVSVAPALQDQVLRRALIEAAGSESFVFCSSVGESHDRDAFFAAIDGVPPGAVLARSTPIEEHHGRTRFGWRFEDPTTGTSFDERPFGVYSRGMDFATLDDDGRLASLSVFVDAGLAEGTKTS
jgi:hypothetical protein